MTTDVAAAREELDHASDVADGERRRQVNSIEEGLMELTEGDKVEGEGGSRPDRLEELEAKLDRLSAEVENRELASHLENALDHLDAVVDRREP